MTNGNDLLRRSDVEAQINRDYELRCGLYGKTDALVSLGKVEPVDAVPVVRCKDCKYGRVDNEENGDMVECCGYWTTVYSDGFCSCGAKMEGGAHEA